MGLEVARGRPQHAAKHTAVNAARRAERTHDADGGAKGDKDEVEDGDPHVQPQLAAGLRSRALFAPHGRNPSAEHERLNVVAALHGDSHEEPERRESGAAGLLEVAPVEPRRDGALGALLLDRQTPLSRPSPWRARQSCLPGWGRGRGRGRGRKAAPFLATGSAVTVFAAVVFAGLRLRLGLGFGVGLKNRGKPRQGPQIRRRHVGTRPRRPLDLPLPLGGGEKVFGGALPQNSASQSTPPFPRRRRRCR
mmetsp:Transcript_53077/g.120980  ORF Transcript_53077/g.120980 Transcript_53077/m.120980 type:complete len:250 (-) Transcript_53077:118-867(-)